jgi:hypothetical protein
MSVLSAIQKSLKVGKENRNEFGKYNYRNCADILEAVKPLMPTGFCVTLSDEMVMVGERYYIKATATLSDGTESHSVTAYARESLDKKGMDDSQITGATSSYARKYALNGLFAIDDTKDADSMDNSDHTTHTKPAKPQKPTASDEADAMWITALSAVQTAPDMDSLQKHFIAAKSLISTPVERDRLTSAKDVRKDQLTAMTKEQSL